MSEASKNKPKESGPQKPLEPDPKLIDWLKRDLDTRNLTTKKTKRK